MLPDFFQLFETFATWDRLPEYPSIMSIATATFSIKDFRFRMNESSAFDKDQKLSVDQECVRRLALGDVQAMEELILRWKRPLFAFFLRSLPNFADAEDLTQKTFVRLYGSVSRYQPKAKFSTWLFTIARNLLIDELKRRKRRPQEVELEDFSSFGSTEGTTKREWEEVLSVEIEKLPENHRSALLLRIQQEWSYREIADLMNASESSVKTWIHRARLALREALNEFRK